MSTPTGAAGAASSASAASTAHLSNSALNLVALRDYYRAELANLLNLPSAGSNPREKKALVLDKTLSGPLGLVAEVDLLRANGVDQVGKRNTRAGADGRRGQQAWLLVCCRCWAAAGTFTCPPL